MTNIGRPTGTLQERLWRRVVKTETCWLWQGFRAPSGHGQIGRGRRSEGQVLVHVAAWEELRGPVPAGQFVLHKCDVPNCVNPDHLYIGTKSANLKDAWERGQRTGRWLADAKAEFLRLPPKQAAEFFGITLHAAYVQGHISREEAK